MKYYAFDFGGTCFPLGDCGDYEAAEEIANDTMLNDWIFLYTKEDIIEVLKLVEDPELAIDVWTLGLIYECEVKDDVVDIKMTFTSPMCPYGPMLLELIEEGIKVKHKDIKSVNLEVVFDPPWEPSEELRAMFGV